MLKEETIRFIKNSPPFDLLPSEDLESIVDVIALDYYPKGVHILTQGGAPANHLYLIKKGGVKVYMTSESEDEMVVDYRSEGEHFGLLSMLSGDRSRYNIVAVEDAICYLVPKKELLEVLQKNPIVNEYLLKSFFINFIDKTYDESRRKYSGLSEGDKALFATPSGDIVRREPITAPADISIQEAAREMAEHKISSLIITGENGVPVGIVTDRDLREKVVAKGLDLGHPARMIMSSPLIKVDAEEFCFEALLKMMRYNIHHILVVEGGRFKGILTNHDFMVLQGSSPMVLAKEMEEIQSLENVEETTQKFYRSVATLMREGAKSHNVTGIITELTEKLLNRIVDLIERQIGEAPVPYSLFLFGEGGRRELSLYRSLKLGVAYEDTQSLQVIRGVEKYFRELGKHIASAMPVCDFSGGRECILAENVRSYSDWKELFHQWAENPEKNRPRPEFVDIRAIRGDESGVESLRLTLIGLMAENDEMMDVVATHTVENRPPLGFFRRFVVEKSGEHRSELNLFEKGIRPLVEAVRIFAVERGVENLTTRRRAQELRSRFAFAHTDDIESALEYLFTLLLHHQVRQVEEGSDADNFINPENLTTIDKKTLKETFHLTATLYDVLEKIYRTERVGS